MLKQFVILTMVACTAEAAELKSCDHQNIFKWVPKDSDSASDLLKKNEIRQNYINAWEGDQILFGLMMCEVKSADVTTISDGKTQIYTHYSGQFDVGETLNVEYKLSNDDCLSFDIFALDENGSKSINANFGVTATNAFRVIREARLANLQTGQSIGKVTKKTISISYANNIINLRNYSASKFDGIWIRRNWENEFEAQVVTLDCQKSGANFESIIKKLKPRSKE